MELQLIGTRAVVTGGTRGIGRAIVAGLLDEGAVVGFCARDGDEVAATEAELRARGAVTGSVVDVGDGDALAAWVQQSAEALGGLDVVGANVSALAIPDTEENWLASLYVDLMHTVRLVRAATPYLEASDSAEVPPVCRRLLILFLWEQGRSHCGTTKQVPGGVPGSCCCAGAGLGPPDQSRR